MRNLQAWTRLAQIPEIRDYRLEQHRPTEYELQLVLTGNAGGVLERCRQVLESLYGEDGEYTVVVVPDILPGPSGKYRRTHADFGFDRKGLFA